MLGTDHEIYEKFVAITAIVKIPGLRFSIMSGVLNFSWQGGPLTEMSMIVFRDLEPIEIVVQKLTYQQFAYSVPFAVKEPVSLLQLAYDH